MTSGMNLIAWWDVRARGRSPHDQSLVDGRRTAFYLFNADRAPLDVVTTPSAEAHALFARRQRRFRR